MSRRIHQILVTLLIIGSVLQPLVALAQAGVITPSGNQQQAVSIESYQAKSGDASLGMLHDIFGDANGIFSGGKDASTRDAINAAFLAFNTAVISAAAAFFTFNMLAAVAQGSFDGEFLGKRYHSMWMPLRTTTGVIYLLPVWKGWSTGQLLMAFAASVGIGIGNSVTSAIGTGAFPSMVAAPEIPSIQTITSQMVDRELCLVDQKQEQIRWKKARVDTSEPSLAINWDMKVFNLADPDKIVVSYGAFPDSDGKHGASCGQVLIDLPRLPEYASAEAKQIRDTSTSVLRAEIARLAEDVHQLYTQSYFSGTPIVVPGDTPLTVGMGADPEDPAAQDKASTDVRKQLPTLVAKAIEKINTRVNAALQVANAGAEQRIKDLINQWGWVAYGAAPAANAANALAMVTGAAKIGSGSTPEHNSPASANAQKAGFSPGNRLTAAQEKQLSAMESSMKNNGANSQIVANQLATQRAAMLAENARGQAMQQQNKVLDQASGKPRAGGCDLSMDMFNRCIMDPITQSVQTNGIGSVVVAGSNPLVSMPLLGAKILNLVGDVVGLFLAATASLAVGLGIASLAGLATLAGWLIVAQIIGWVGLVLLGFLLPLAVLGLQLVVFLPMAIPLAWLFAVGAWLVIVAESLMGAQLWGLAHLDPEGEGMGQRTAHGYIFLLNLLFRPAILVIACWFAYKFCGVLGGFANAMLTDAVTALLHGSTGSLIVYLLVLTGGVWLTLVTNIQVIHVSASLLNIIPNQIFAWVGGHFGSDVGSGISHNTEGSFKGGMSGAGAVVQKTANQLARPLKNEKGGKDRQKQSEAGKLAAGSGGEMIAEE
ncbi:DotA/TraY family protein [Oryzomicrobium sp.]|uniref:DotA/TraY family protein n=1 Tax=Oryzomicrobium sp. TaxID=1911578 RepID=UPI002FDF9F8F